MPAKARAFNGEYKGDHLSRVAFPLGGIGAGMLCLEGTGALSHVSLRHRPEMFHEPSLFSAICIKGGADGSDPNESGSKRRGPNGADPNVARVLEGPVPSWKVFGAPNTGNGAPGTTYGLPRFADASFAARFPFATVKLSDGTMPVGVEITGWSPFVPGDEDNSSLPVAALEFRFINRGKEKIDAVYSFNAKNFMATGGGGEEVRRVEDGFIFWQPPGDGVGAAEQGAFCAVVDDPAAVVDCAWFRGSWWDPLTVVWRNVAAGRAEKRDPYDEGAPSPGASIYVPFELQPGGVRRIRLLLSWYVPCTELRTHPRSGGDPAEICCTSTGCEGSYRPWYAGRFGNVTDIADYWRAEYPVLYTKTATFTESFYDTTLPPEIVEAVAANLTILKSPTVLRQEDGRLWAWEGCSDNAGCCPGSCTHVWNYAQAIPHLFPSLERTLRRTEFKEMQSGEGHQQFRALLPIRPAAHDFHAAADGQLGCVVKVYRDWRISGDTEWLRSLWPKVKQALDYAVRTWDPKGKGVLVEPHHNTYDIEFWGPDGMCSSFYLAALQAAVKMGTELEEDVTTYAALFERGRLYLERELFNGEYFYQKVEWIGLRAGDPVESPSLRTEYSPEGRALIEREGPKYQYGTGCLSDGVLGVWLAAVSGVNGVLDDQKVRSHLSSVYEYNFRRDLSEHANPQRPAYALGDEGGLLLCTWPHGGEPTLPFVYSNEVWTGIEYQVASHLMLNGMVAEGLEVVRACRGRYDGTVRNPFDEYECGHWYARAMASYALIQGLTGIRYDAVTRTLYVRPNCGGDFRSFLCTEFGYGVAGVRDGKAFVEVRAGEIPVEKIEYRPYSA